MSTDPTKGRVTVSVRGDASRSEESRERPPRENLVRAVFPGPELREAEDGGMPTLVMRFSPFGEWTEINSSWEGHFLEKFAPTAFDKTIAENRSSMRVLFNHGKDPQIGDKVLGPIADIRAEEDGAYATVPLFDTSYNKDLLPGLEAGVYGSSHRFKVMREEFDKSPKRSSHNPDGLPERVVTEARLLEMGPVTFPAYQGATAGVRSMTDDWIASKLLEDGEIAKRFAEFYVMNFGTTGQPHAPSPETPAEATSPPERRVVNRKRFNSREDYLEWLSSLS